MTIWYLTELLILSSSDKGIHWCKSFRIVDEDTQKRAKYFRYPTYICRSHPHLLNAAAQIYRSLKIGFCGVLMNFWRVLRLRWGLRSIDWTAIARRKVGGQKRFAIENVFAEDILFQQIFQLDDVTSKIEISGVRRRSTSLIHENSKGALCSLESTVLPTSDVTNKIRKM